MPDVGKARQKGRCRPPSLPPSQTQEHGGSQAVPVITQTKEGKLSPFRISCSNSVFKKTHHDDRIIYSGEGRVGEGNAEGQFQT